MDTPAQRVALTQIGTITVSLITLALGLLLAAWTYWTGEPDPEFGKELVFQCILLATLVMTVCNLTVLLLTLPVYFGLRLPFERKRMVLHCTVSTLICAMSLVPVWLLETYMVFTDRVILFAVTIFIYIISFSGSLLAQALWLRKGRGDRSLPLSRDA